MSKPSVTFLINRSTDDVACSNPAGDANFMVLDGADKICWRDSQQMDQDPANGPAYPVIIPMSNYIEAPKTFLKDASDNKYIQIPLAGSSAGGQSGGDKQYVFCAYFGGATASQPYLEAWDDATFQTAQSNALSAGCFLAIATTNGPPGSATWAGTPLAGLTSRIALDSAALTGAKYLYWNMKQVIDYSAINWPSGTWSIPGLAFAIHYTYQ